MPPSNLLLFAIPVLLLVMMFVSQRRRQRTFEQLQAGLQPGQEILTTAGLYATVVEVGDTVVVLEPAPGVRLRWDRRAIASVLPAGATGQTDPTQPSTGATGRPVVDTTKHLDPPPASTDEK